MNTSESAIFWIGSAVLVVILLNGVTGIRLAFRIDARLRELLRIASEIEAMIGQIRLHAPSPGPTKAAVQRATPTPKSKVATASCNCQHCGREFLFYLEGFSDEKSFGRCPGCGKLTKLRLPGERNLDSGKPALAAVCGTCATHIPFNKGEEWTKTTCPVCGSETILQAQESEIKR